MDVGMAVGWDAVEDELPDEPAGATSVVSYGSHSSPTTTRCFQAEMHLQSKKLEQVPLPQSTTILQ